jgi:hypothetical protein
MPRTAGNRPRIARGRPKAPQGRARGRPGPARRTASGQDTAGTLFRIASIASPLALGTALLFYFGWVSTTTQARELGYSSSIIDLSTTDYILSSIEPLYLPLVLLLIAALALNGLHRWMVGRCRVQPRHRTRLRRLARLLRLSWILWVPLGIILLEFAPLSSFAIPFSITLALLCAMYGRWLQKAATGVDPWLTTSRVLILALLAAVVFWDAERVARTFGEWNADLIIASPRMLTAVTVYSARDLQLTAPGIVETELGGDHPEYRYRYSGLRLLERSGDSYFLINEQWDKPQGRVIVLRDTDGVRLEFASRP